MPVFPAAGSKRSMKPSVPVAAVQDRILPAIGLMCTYVGLIVCVNATGKVLATAGYHPQQVVFFRHGVAFLLMLLLFAPRHGVSIVVARRPGLQVVRGIFAITSSLFYFTGLASVSLPLAAAISFTSPLLVTALSGPLLGEQVGVRRWAAVAVGFVGAMIVIRPGGDTEWAGLLIVGSAACAALYQITTRRLAGQDHAETTNIWTGLVGAALMCVLVPFVWEMPESPQIWLLFISMGLIGGIAHYILTKAFERGPASLLSPFSYLQLIGATVAGYILYGDLPDGMTWVGAAVIVAAGLYIAHRESRRRKAPPQAG